MSQRHSATVESLDLGGLETLAQSMLSHLSAPLSVGLVGTLGVGKTTLVQAIARAAGIDAADVTSPTFTLLQTHRGQLTLHHLDAYRIADEDEFLELGVDELFDDASAWTLIEWADRVRDVLPCETLWVELEIAEDADLRTITLETRDNEIAAAVDRIVGEMKSGSQ